jgi:uncharacterized membrane protein
LALFAGLSVLASAVYFFLSPLKEANSELLARTSPTLWDVIIAFFGGAAGMVGLTRKEKSNLLPGVAIATALMPPLCTAGYGIATAQAEVFVGAFFLFVINAVFIALATLAVARLLRLPDVTEPDPRARRNGQIAIAALLVVTVVPSTYLAYRLVHDELFVSQATRFVSAVAQTKPGLHPLSSDIQAGKRTITLVMLGSGLTPAVHENLKAQLQQRGLEGVDLIIRTPDQAQAYRDASRKEVLQPIARDAQAQQKKLSDALERLAQHERLQAETMRLEAEIKAQLPMLHRVLVSVSARSSADGPDTRSVVVVLEASKTLGRTELERLKRWLKVRQAQSTPDPRICP